MTLSECSMCIIPYQGIGSPLCSLFLIRLLSGAQDRGWRGRILVPHILQSQKPDPIEKTGHTIRSRCACVWNFLDGTRTPFYMTLSFILRYGLSFFFFFFFFLFLCFWAWILFLFLSHSPYSFCNMKSHVKMIRVFLCGWKAYFCATFSVEVGRSICGVFVILILKAWNESRKSHKQFDKVQCKNKYHMNKVRQRWQHMALVGI